MNLLSYFNSVASTAEKLIKNIRDINLCFLN